MKKKKIKKLEILKEDVINLSNDQAKGVVGGDLSDYYWGTLCVSTMVECNGSDATSYCSSTIADTQLCNLSSGGNCYTDWYGGGCRT